MAEEQEIQDPVIEEPEATPDEDGAEEEPDYKALYEQVKAQAEKAENDRKAALGSRKSQQERDDLLWGVNDRLSAMEKANTALLKALTTGETENLTSELNTIQNETASSRAERQFNTQYASIYETLQEAISDDEGNALVDLKAEEDFVKGWREAYDKHDIVALTKHLTEIQVKARKVERERAKAAIEEAKKASKVGAKKDKTKKADLDLGPASGAASNSLTSAEKIARGLAKRDEK